MREELILASKSPFRAQLLANAGIAAEICGADIDERAVEAAFAAGYSGESAALPQKLAEALAQAKALEVSARFADAAVIGCDQILELEGRILHKTADEEAAFQRLTQLAGKTHRLHSAFCLARGGAVLSSGVGAAEMTMRALSADYIRSYLKREGETVLKSVGVYQIEGRGIKLFDSVQGDYWTIIGLPMLPLLKALRGFKLAAE